MNAEIVAQNAEGEPILVAKVSGKHLSPAAVDRLFLELDLTRPSIPFHMVADLAEIRIVSQGFQGDRMTSCTIHTNDVLRSYEPDFGRKRIFQDYFARLIESWLRDLAYHWNSDNPPGSEPLAAIGLLHQLEGGMAESEAPLGNDSLR